MERQQRFGSRLPRLLSAALLVTALVSCSNGANQTAPATSPVAAAPRTVFALVTHQAPGDTFWDLVRRGAEAAAAKDNIDLRYFHDRDPAAQAKLVQAAVAEKVAGIAVTLADPPMMSSAVRSAVSEGIPVVALNTGIDAWKSMGVLAYFGQDEALAGRAVGERLTAERAQNTLCIIQERGHVGLEARCAGLAQGFAGQTQKLYVDGTNVPATRAMIAARLQQDRSIDRVLALGAPVATTALKAAGDANSYAKVVTFDTNAAVVEAIKRGTIEWAVDQQPFLQGYLSVAALWLYVTNRNTMGGGLPVLTGPSFVDESNVDEVAERAREGTR